MKSLTLHDPQIQHNMNVRDLLFFSGFILYLGRGVWSTTMFPLPGIISKLCLGLPILLLGLKILLYDCYSLAILCLLCAIALDSILVLQASSYLNIFYWTLLIIAARNISFRKILQVYLIVTGAIIFLAFTSSLLGVIENLTYTQEGRGVRQSFGIIYTTDFASHIFYLMLTFFCLKGPDLKKAHYIGAAVMTGFVYHFCKTRLDCISISLLILLFALGNTIEHSSSVPYNTRALWKRLWMAGSPYIMPFLALLSICLTFFYTAENTVLQKLNLLISSRLDLGKKGIETYGFTLWGQAIEMIGNGGSSHLSNKYFFIDCSYLFVALRYGLVALLILLCVYFISCFRNRHDLYFLYAIALIAINCVIAHHILELEYNPFALALLSIPIRVKQPASPFRL